jgi:hypothetical protein
MIMHYISICPVSHAFHRTSLCVLRI